MVLIIGNIGNIREILVDEMLKRGIEFRLHETGLSNTTVTDLKLPHNLNTGDLSSVKDVQGICKNIATIVYIGNFGVTNKSRSDKRQIQCLMNVIKEAKSNYVKHFIFVSTSAALYHNPTEYSMAVRVCEDLVKDSKLSWSIVRPTLVYGKKGSYDFINLLQWLHSTPIVPFVNQGKTLIRPVDETTLAHALLVLIAESCGFGQICNFSGDKVYTIRQFIEFCIQEYNVKKKKFVNIPIWSAKFTVFIYECLEKSNLISSDLLHTVLFDCIPENNFEKCLIGSLKIKEC